MVVGLNHTLSAWSIGHGRDNCTTSLPPTPTGVMVCIGTRKRGSFLHFRLYLSHCTGTSDSNVFCLLGAWALMPSSCAHTVPGQRMRKPPWSWRRELNSLALHWHRLPLDCFSPSLFFSFTCRIQINNCCVSLFLARVLAGTQGLAHSLTAPKPVWRVEELKTKATKPTTNQFSGERKHGA